MSETDCGVKAESLGRCREAEQLIQKPRIANRSHMEKMR
jgi:hypothetical protein